MISQFLAIMSKDKPINDSITIPEYVPIFDKIAWLNTEQEDYKLLKNKPTIPTAYTLPNSSTTVIWWVKLVTAPVYPTNPLAVWDNDPRLTKYYKSWLATLASWTANATITVGFTPTYVRITASQWNNYSAFYTSWSTSSSSNWIWFDFQSWFWTTAYSSTYALDIRRNSQKYESTITFLTNKFILDHNWSQFTTDIMWEAFA